MSVPQLRPIMMMRKGGIRVYQLGLFNHDTTAGSVSSGTLVLPEAGLVVGACCGNDASSSKNVTSIVFGGTTGTLHAASPAGHGFAGIGSLAMAAGSMSGVVANHGTADFGCLGVWLLAGLQSNTPVDTTVVGNTSTSGTGSSNTSLAGVALGVSFHQNTSAVVWTGLTKISEILGNRSYSWAQLFPTLASSPLAITASWTGSAAQGIAVGTWR